MNSLLGIGGLNVLAAVARLFHGLGAPWYCAIKSVAAHVMQLLVVVVGHTGTSSCCMT